MLHEMMSSRMQARPSSAGLQQHQHHSLPSCHVGHSTWTSRLPIARGPLQLDAPVTDHASTPQHRARHHRYPAVQAAASHGQADPQQPEGQPAGGAAAAGQQQQASSSTSEAQEQEAGSSQAAAAAADPDVVEATRILEPSSQMAWDPIEQALMSELPLMPAEVNTQAVRIYLGLGTLFTAQAVGLACAALLQPSALLPGDAAGPLGSTLLGCAAAAAAQAAALCLHLMINPDLEELGTWRHQRLNAVLLLFSAVCGVSALVGITASQPLLTAALLVSSVLGTLGCAWVARSCWAHGPWLQWLLAPGDLATTCNHLLAFVRRDFTTVAGTLCLLWMAVSSCAAAGVLFDGMSWSLNTLGLPAGGHFLSHPWYPYATSWRAAGALDVLRRVCGAGLLLSAATAHTLLEAAFYMRAVPLMAWLKVNLPHVIRPNDPLTALIRPPEARFAVLTLFGVLAAGALQAYFLLNAPGLGANVNADAALMGPLHWTTMIALVYAFIAIFRLDWSSVRDTVMGVFDLFANMVSAVFRTFVMKLEWMLPQRL